MYDCDVALPRNLDDRDIDAQMTVTQMPAERVGVTEMSFVLMMMEIVRLVASLAKLLNGSGSGSGIVGGGHGPAMRSNCLKAQSKRLVEETRLRMDTGTLRHCDVSRPFDWFLLVITKVLLVSFYVLCFPDLSQSIRLYLLPFLRFFPPSFTLFL